MVERVGCWVHRVVKKLKGVMGSMIPPSIFFFFFFLIPRIEESTSRIFLESFLSALCSYSLSFIYFEQMSFTIHWLLLIFLSFPYFFLKTLSFPFVYFISLIPRIFEISYYGYWQKLWWKNLKKGAKHEHINILINMR